MREENITLLLGNHILGEIPAGKREVKGIPEKNHGKDIYTLKVEGDLLTASEKYLVRYDPERKKCWSLNCGKEPRSGRTYFHDGQSFIVLVGNLLFERK